MALLKSFEQIKDIIPERVDDFYKCGIASVSQDVLNKHHIYGIVVDGKTKEVIKAYEIEFSLFSGTAKHYLFIGKRSQDVTNANYFISVDTGGYGLQKTDWKFEVDNLGLHVKCGINNDIIYFAENYNDMNEVLSVYSTKPVNRTIITETVYV